MIKEINDLRRELKITRMRLHDIESSLGSSKNTKSTAMTAQKRQETLAKSGFLFVLVFDPKLYVILSGIT